MPMVNLLLRAVLLLMGLLFAASLAVAAVVLVVVWVARAGWARLTGRPVMPWVMRFDPRDGFERFRAASREEPPPSAAEVVSRRAQVGRQGADVDDAVIKPPSRAR